MADANLCEGFILSGSKVSLLLVGGGEVARSQTKWELWTFPACNGGTSIGRGHEVPVFAT